MTLGLESMEGSSSAPGIKTKPEGRTRTWISWKPNSWTIFRVANFKTRRYFGCFRVTTNGTQTTRTIQNTQNKCRLVMPSIGSLFGWQFRIVAEHVKGCIDTGCAVTPPVLFVISSRKPLITFWLHVFLVARFGLPASRNWVGTFSHWVGMTRSQIGGFVVENR
jgi:hypothetical protein